jgi:hypothetical protein
MENPYDDFLQIQVDSFEKLKKEYLFKIDIAREKESAHNIFEQENMRKRYEAIQLELGQESRFLLEIRNDMKLDVRIEESTEFSSRLNKVDKARRETMLKMLGELEAIRRMYDYWHQKGKVLRNGESYFESFERRYKMLLELHKIELNRRIEKARDKKLALEKFANDYMTPIRNTLAPKLGQLGTFFNEMEEIYNLDNSKERAEIFNEKMEVIQLGKKEESLELLSELHANWLMIGVEGDAYRKHVNNPKLSVDTAPYDIDQSYYVPDKTQVYWKGVNETEFVQLIYALHEADYLKHETNEITSLVTELAGLLNFELGKNWQSNFSKSVNNRKADYKPEIFEKLPASFERYRDKQINKKKKN